MKTFVRIIPFMIFTLLLSACGNAGAPVTQSPYPTYTPYPTRAVTVGSGIFFDDFNYSGSDDPSITARGWTLRDTQGGPGIAGALWTRDSISFVDDPDLPGNRLAQLTATTSGQPENTYQAELFQQRKFYEGTFASRVRFNDAPASGPDGDQVVETFFTITPLNYDMDPDYGEIDFEYLPNGGWGATRNTFWMTTWETYRGDPWEAVSEHDSIPLSFGGWHTLIAQVSGVRVKYFIDGAELGEHGDVYYPETPMSINFNLWFIEGGLADSAAKRQYIEQVDWVYYAGNEVLDPAEVDRRVAEYRGAGIQHVDEVPAWTAPLVAIPLTPTPVAAGQRPFEADIPQVNDIQIDGKLNDWGSAPTFTIDQQSQVVYLSDDGKWEGPEDLSTLAWIGWTEDGLCLAFQVKDDVIAQDNIGADLWQGDYIEVQLDTQLDEDYDDRNMSSDDHQLGFSPGDFGATSPSLFSWQGPITDAQISQIQQAQTRTEDGYILEVCIPKELLSDLELVEGVSLGLNINPSDSDFPEVPQELMMSTSPTRLRTDPTTFGKVTLASK